MSDVVPILIGVGVLISLSSIISYFVVRRQLFGSLEMMAPVLGEVINESVKELFINPTVKGAMTQLGKLGGDASAENRLVDTMAMEMLDSPQFEAIKMGASSLLGFDIDAYIEKHGAVKTLKAANQLANSLGIDLANIDLGAILGGVAQGGSGDGGNPYLRR